MCKLLDTTSILYEAEVSNKISKTYSKKQGSKKLEVH